MFRLWAPMAGSQSKAVATQKTGIQIAGVGGFCHKMLKMQ